MNGAIVTQIKKIKPHPNADRLQLGVVAGFQVIVGLDVEDGEIGVFFDSNLQLSDEYCSANDLYPRYDENGKRIGGGFFNPKKRRVKAQTFRGEKSYGYWAPLQSLAFTGYNISQLKSGDRFLELNGVPICNKYIVAVDNSNKAKNKRVKTNRRELPGFAMHFDTEQFKYKKDQIKTGSICHVTEKLHGTSQRYGLVGVYGAKKWWHRLFNLTPQKTWQYLMGTRRVIVDSNGGYYGDMAFRERVVENVTLRRGEVLYFEVVGYVNSERPIMNSVATKSIKDKAFRKQYGSTMTFKYGQPPDTQKAYVYRIVQHTPDNQPIELSWVQVKQRCKELGIAHVPEIDSFVFDGNVDVLEERLESCVDGPSMLDPSHIREGVCLRIEDGNTTIYKHKSFNFYVLEGVLKDNEVVDIEDQS